MLCTTTVLIQTVLDLLLSLLPSMIRVKNKPRCRFRMEISSEVRPPLSVLGADHPETIPENGTKKIRHVFRVYRVAKQVLCGQKTFASRIQKRRFCRDGRLWAMGLVTSGCIFSVPTIIDFQALSEKPPQKPYAPIQGSMGQPCNPENILANKSVTRILVTAICVIQRIKR